ncbi:MAG: hypothetical protein ACP5T0_13345 [Verrucomicrobiia bacterium]
MNFEEIKRAIKEIEAETEMISKTLRVASLVSRHFRDNNVELVVVGRAAIGMLTDGAPPGNDLDFCLIHPQLLSPRRRQMLMGELGGIGGPRGWSLCGIHVSIHGLVESFSRTKFRQINAPYGDVLVMKPEDLLVERVLVSVFPTTSQGASSCVRGLVAAALKNKLSMDWQEVLRLSSLPEYKVKQECESMIRQVAKELNLPSPI